ISSTPSSSLRSTKTNIITMSTIKESDWMIRVNKEVEVEKKLNIDLDVDLNHDSVVCCVKFSLDGKYIATGCNKKAQIFDVIKGTKIKEFIDNDDSGDESDQVRYIRSVVF